MKTTVLVVLPFIILAVGLALFAANVPIGDDYDAILNYLNYPWPERFFHLADFHNEHRIISTRLVSEIVYRVLGNIDFRVIIWIGNLGWWIFAAVFAWLFWKHGGIFRWGAVFATWMLVGFYDHENAFWAMTAIQNHWVIAFAFAACLCFSRRADSGWFAASLAFAVAATFTSGGGLLIFPALAMMAICDYVFGHDRSIGNRRIIGTVIFIIIAVTACGQMLHNLPHNNDPALTFSNDPIQRLKGIVGFFFCFFGNIIPLAWSAFIAGMIVVAYGLVICVYIPRYRRTSLALFAFLAFLVANILAATVFRGFDASGALPGRYRLISATIIVSIIYLTLKEIPLKQNFKHVLIKSAIAGCLAISAIYIIRGITYNSSHKTSLINGISQWPSSTDGLDYPTDRFGRAHASSILQKSVNLKIYPR